MEEYDLYIISLYDTYNSLLTDKQKLYFEDYYFNNLSLSEMSENYEVSRNAIHKQIKEVNRGIKNIRKSIKDLIDILVKTKKSKTISNKKNEITQLKKLRNSKKMMRSKKPELKPRINQRIYVIQLRIN